MQLAGIEADPDEKWMLQQARNITDPDGILASKRILIHDRDPLFTKQFRQTCKAAGIRCLKLPKRSPNLNAFAECFVRAIKRECLDKMVLFGERHVRHVIEEYIEHYNDERPHQGLGNLRINELETPPPRAGPVACHERLASLLRSYHREAA